MSSILGRVKTSTLLQIAGGTLIIGSTFLYFAHKNVQRKVRALPHYSQFLEFFSSSALLRNIGIPHLLVGHFLSLCNFHLSFFSNLQTLPSSLLLFLCFFSQQVFYFLLVISILVSFTESRHMYRSGYLSVFDPYFWSLNPAYFS
uniref:Uncharacterized protein n=1 Tax=Parascaris equorum TaxID=6256 RepID=A0A914REV5_PAREQ